MSPPYKRIQDSLKVWIPRRGFRILGTGFHIFNSGIWIPDSNCFRDPGFLELEFGFRSRGFRYHKTAKISQISVFCKQKFIPESGFPYFYFASKCHSSITIINWLLGYLWPSPRGLAFPIPPRRNIEEFRILRGRGVSAFWPWNFYSLKAETSIFHRLYSV